MRETLTAPTKGSPLRASWGAAVADAVNALAPFASVGMLAREGLGTGAEPLPENRRVKSSKATDTSCFRFGSVEATEEGETVAHTALVCCYFSIGGVLRHMADTDIQELLPSAPADGEQPTATYICLKLTGTTPSIVAVTESNLAAEQANADNYVRPLYLYSGATLTADLRNAPQLQMFEGGLA